MTDPTYLTPTTELEAVNTILNVMGDSPVSSIGTDDPESAESAIALQVLREVSRDVQTEGWHWNTEIEMTVTPDADDFVYLPTNCLRVDKIEFIGSPWPDSDIIERGGRLYDRRNQTYEFDAAFSVDMVILLAFEELPQAARRYITIQAAQTHQQRQLGSITKSNFTEDQLMRAKLNLEQAEADTDDMNQLHKNPSLSRLYKHRRVL